MMTDPIADMLTRIRNAVRIERPTVDVPASKVKRGVADVLKREGFIWDWREVEGSTSPGTASPSPKTMSAGEACMSGLNVVRIVSMTIGSFQNHWFGSSRPKAMSASFKRL